MKRLSFLILGNESRQIFLKEMLENIGHKVMLSEDYVEGEYDAFLLPVPTSAMYFEKIKDQLRGGQYVFGCNVPEFKQQQLHAMYSQMHQKEMQRNNRKDYRRNNRIESLKDPRMNQDVRIVEYMKSDAVAYKNAIATAEGAISEAIRNSDINLHGSCALLTGFGRCGEILADKLKGLNCQVTVMDRKAEKRARAQAYGYQSMDFNVEQLKGADCKKYGFVFNTVPYLVVNQTMIDVLPKEICMIDIASKPGGIDHEYCKKIGVSSFLLPGLPGKYAPKTSAAILLEVIKDSMGNWEV